MLRKILHDVDWKRTLIHLIQGAIVGVGAILPGISGGILCVIFGIYAPLMELLTSPKTSIKKYYKMFVPFVLGWLIGFVLLARITERFFTLAPNVATYLFFGLVCGSIPTLLSKCDSKGRKDDWTPFVASVATSYIFLHVIEAGEAISVALNFWSFLLCGLLWGLSLIVPGLCSATILIYLGLYVPFADGVATFDFSVILPFLLGVALVVLLLSRLVNMLFKKHYNVMMQIIVGFVISSSLKTLPNTFENLGIVFVCVVCSLIGFAVANFFEAGGDGND